MAQHRPTRTTPSALFACALLMLLAGCQGFRLPAIDPTGQRIFAPGQTTTLNAAPRAALFQPAFTTPAAPPPCTDISPSLPPTIPPSIVVPGPTVVGPSIGVPAAIQPQPTITLPGPVTPGRRGSIVLTPAEMIAPVGSEVVLRAGLCGEDGFYVTGQPVEFMLGNESVGHLVAVGEDDRCSLVRRISSDRSAERRTDSFAIGRTASANVLLGRGTTGHADDIQLLAGQTWVSVTSGGEGISRVTAVAPNASNWDGRFQTATIRWIDAQWSPPAPAISRSGAQHNLTTTVTRSSDGSPLVGWTVRYEVLEGPPAQFVSPDGSQGGAAADATTDSNGAASVLMMPTSNQPGTTRVRMQILHPATADSGAISVGQAFTSVTWSSPGLAANIIGPQQAGAGETISYHLEISNPGDITVSNVVVTHVLPPEVSYLGSNPPANVFGNRLEWRLPRVDPGMVVGLDVSVSVEGGGDLAHVVTAQSDEGLAAEATAITRVQQNALLLRVEGPLAARLGEQAEFQITLTNTSQQILTGVVVTDELGPGLLHETRVSRIERAIGQLGPQQSFDFAVVLAITQAGELCQMLSATADGGHFASARSCLQVALPPAPSGPILGQPPTTPQPASPITPIPPDAPAPRDGAPDVTVTVTGPAEAAVGQIAQFQIVVNNTGGLPLTNVRVTSRIDANMVPSLATPGFFPAEGGGIFWMVKEFPVGHLVTINVHARCDRMAERACERVTVESDQLPAKEAEACLAIGAQQGRADSPAMQTNVAHRPANEPTPADPADKPATPASDAGELEVSIASITSPVVVGAPVTYVVQIHNGRTVADQDVALRLDLPTALRFERLLAGPVEGQTVSGSGKTVVFRPVREIRPDETITFRILLRSERSGPVEVNAQATSRRQGEPAAAATTTMIQ